MHSIVCNIVNKQHTYVVFYLFKFIDNLFFKFCRKSSFESVENPRTRSRRIRKKQEELNNDGFPLTSPERKKIIRTYDKIIIYRFVDHWGELVGDVSKKTGIEPEAVRSCLRKYFE